MLCSSACQTALPEWKRASRPTHTALHAHKFCPSGHSAHVTADAGLTHISLKHHRVRRRCAVCTAVTHKRAKQMVINVCRKRDEAPGGPCWSSPDARQGQGRRHLTAGPGPPPHRSAWMRGQALIWYYGVLRTATPTRKPRWRTETHPPETRSHPTARFKMPCELCSARRCALPPPPLPALLAASHPSTCFAHTTQPQVARPGLDPPSPLSPLPLVPPRPALHVRRAASPACPHTGHAPPARPQCARTTA